MLTSGIAYLLLVLSTAVNIYLFVLFVRVLLTWFPNIDFSNPVLGGVASITADRRDRPFSHPGLHRPAGAAGSADGIQRAISIDEPGLLIH